jgi:hypothetical protein
VLVVEDSTRGLNAAVAAGIDRVIVENRFTTSQEFSRATHRVTNLAELSDLIVTTPCRGTCPGPVNFQEVQNRTSVVNPMTVTQSINAA